MKCFEASAHFSCPEKYCDSSGIYHATAKIRVSSRNTITEDGISPLRCARLSNTW